MQAIELGTSGQEAPRPFRSGRRHVVKVVVFVSGAVLMALEILGSRVLAPHYGSSVYVWGSLISTFLVALSVGHPATFFADGFEQHEKSWYMLLFQFPGIAEQWLSAEGWANLRTWVRHPDADATIAELEANGSLTPGLNYYRANVRPEALLQTGLELPPVQAPTMGVWSSGDPALTEGQMTRSARNVAGPWRYERLEGPGHWMQLEAPDKVNELLLDFLPR